MGVDRAELRATQAPLKERYREDPGSAVVTLHADGTHLCSGDLLLQALAACAGVTLGAVATSMDIALRSGTVHVDGDLDFRGTLAVDRDAPVGFREIRVRVVLDADASPEQLDKLVALTERYCVVLQSLRAPVSVTVATG